MSNCCFAEVISRAIQNFPLLFPWFVFYYCCCYCPGMAKMPWLNGSTPPPYALPEITEPPTKLPSTLCPPIISPATLCPATMSPPTECPPTELPAT